jgi:hypothetical protein
LKFHPPAGFLENPLFSVTAPDENVSSSIIPNWGSGKPPGGPGLCLVLQNGAAYNASCAEQRNFGCEENPATDINSKMQEI